MDFGRLITAMVTPFNEQLEIDWGQAGKLIDYLIDVQQSDSLVICGTTGESPTLTDDEKLELFKFAVKHANGRCKIIAGTGSYDTRHSIHLSKLAETCGVDGLLLVAPYYNKPSQEGLYQHFRAIAEATKLPVIVYNVPGRSVVNISVATTLRLAELPNVVGTKDCAGLDQLASIADKAPNHFRVYTGDDSSTLPALAIGAYGIVSVSSHVVGAVMKEMIQCFLDGNVQEAAKLHQQCLPIFKGLFEFPNPMPVKYALGLRGIPVGGVRLPLVNANQAEATFIENLLQ